MDDSAEGKQIVYEGKRFLIEFAVRADGSVPARDYMDSLTVKDRAAVLAYMQHLGDYGEVSNPKKFKHESGRLWAFKRKGLNGRLIRLPCYQSGKRWIVTHGFDKPAQSKWPEREFSHAAQIMSEQDERDRLQQEEESRLRK